MSITLDFYCGDAERIGAALAEPDPGALQKPGVLADHVDFSLGFGRDETDVLIEAFCLELHETPVKLRGSLVKHIGGDGAEWSADVVDPNVVRVLAAGDDKIEEIGHRWLEELTDRYGEAPDAPSTEFMTALEGLIVLCQRARSEDLDVVHVWRRIASLEEGFD